MPAESTTLPGCLIHGPGSMVQKFAGEVSYWACLQCNATPASIGGSGTAAFPNMATGTVRITRGTPIERLPPQGAELNDTVDKLNEVIDRINAMNEMPNV